MKEKKEYEISGDMKKIMKQIKKMIEDNIEDNNKPYLINADENGVLLNGELSDILYGLSGIVCAIMQTATQKFKISKKTIEHDIMTAVKFGLTKDLVERNNKHKKEED